MIVATLLTLSATAGRLPALVAVLTLGPVLAQLYSEWRSPRQSSEASALDSRGCLLLGTLLLASRAGMFAWPQLRLALRQLPRRARSAA